MNYALGQTHNPESRATIYLYHLHIYIYKIIVIETSPVLNNLDSSVG